MPDCTWLGWGGLAIGVIGIAVGLFFGLKARGRRELVYSINPVYTRIVRARKATDLKVSYRGESLGDVDVSALQLAIWNAGNLPIKPKHIREKIVITTEPPARILEASVRNASRATGFRLKDTIESRAKGRVPVLWKILERNDEVSLQLLYLGTSNVDITVDGLIEGQGQVKRQVTSSAYRSAKARRKSLQKLLLLAIFSFLGLLVTAILKFVFKIQGPEDIVILLFVLSVFVFPLSLIGIWSTMRERFPPFGF